MKATMTDKEMMELVQKGLAFWVPGMMSVICVSSIDRQHREMNGLWYLDCGLIWHKKRLAPALHPTAQTLMEVGREYYEFPLQMQLIDSSSSIAESYYDWLTRKLLEKEAQ